MESPAASTDLNNLDAIPIDDQQLYDWGIEHRLDQYYGHPDQPQPPQPYPYPPGSQQQNNNKSTTIGYVLPEHVQNQENAYLVTITDDQKPAKNGVSLPINPVPPLKMDKKYHKTIKPNGVPGRRPMLPTLDMDANELMKVNVNFEG